MRKLIVGWCCWVAFVILVSAFLSPFAYYLSEYFFPTHHFPFRRVFNRIVMVSALAGCWVLARYWGVSWAQLGLVDSQWWKKLGRGWIGGIFTLGLLLLLELGAEARELQGTFHLGQAIGILVSGLVIGVVEETLFRGFFFHYVRGLAKHHLLGWGIGMGIFFASVHFLKASDYLMEVDWKSGWWMWGHLYPSNATSHALQEIGLRWVSLVLVGWVLNLIVYRARSLWEAIGWHAGWVMMIKLSSELSQKQPGTNLFWFGSEPFTGASAWVLLIGLCVYFYWRKTDESLAQGSA